MKIFELQADSNRFENLAFADEPDVLGVAEQFNGTPIVRPWRPPRVVSIVVDDVSKRLPPSDFPSLYGVIPVFSRRAVDVLRPLLEQSGELLPLALDGHAYHAFNVTSIADVLDESSSDVERFPDGRIMLIKRHAFVSDVESLLRGNAIFKIPQRRRSACYVTQSFVSEAQHHRLTGFVFRTV